MIYRFLIVFIVGLLGFSTPSWSYATRFKVYAKDVHTLLFHVFAAQTNPAADNKKSHLKSADELLEKISVRLSAADKNLIQQKLKSMALDMSSTHVVDFVQTVVRIYELPTSPVGRPDFEIGKKAYAQNCASCHGANGDGQGPLSAKLSPRPSSFKDANATVFRCYNRNFVGDKMSGKADIFDAMGELNLWSACFYALALPAMAESMPTKSTPMTQQLSFDTLTMGTPSDYEAWSKDLKIGLADLRMLPFRSNTLLRSKR